MTIRVLRVVAAAAIACFAGVTLLAFTSVTFGRGRPFARRVLLPAFARQLLRLFHVRVEILGAMEFPSEPCFFIANHTSSLDVLVVAALGLPNARFFTSRYTLRFVPVTLVNLALGTFFLSEQYEPEKRRREFRAATNTLRRTGESAFLTPEGVRVRTGRVGRFNKAAFHMATVLHRPIVPLFFEIPVATDPGMALCPRAGVIRVHRLPTILTHDWRVEDVEANAARVREAYADFHRRLFGDAIRWERDGAGELLPRARLRHLRSRLRLAVHLLALLFRDVRARRISFADFRFSLRRQRVIGKVFSYAKHATVGASVFIDPFAPRFPSPHFAKVVRNFTQSSFPLKPSYAQIAITNQCPCHCFHCHVQNSQSGDLPRETILDLIASFTRLDFPMLFFVGGEPMSRFDDLLAFVEAASPHMDTRIFTSGVGATPERLTRLRKAGLAGLYVSLDHYQEEEHNRKRGNGFAYQSALAAIRHGVEQGFYVSVVCCTTGDMVRDGSFRKVVDLAESLGAHSIQLNEIRPVGAARNDGDLSISREDKEILTHYYRANNLSPRRIAIAMPWYLEEPERLGCMATSAQKVYVDGHGNVQPCELLKVSVGNILERSFDDIWEKFRAQCRYPVERCIVLNFNEILPEQETLPLAPAKTQETWPLMTAIPMAHAYRKLFSTPPAGPGAFAKKYDLSLARGIDFRVKENHWLPRVLGADLIAFGRTLFARSLCPQVPHHEFLHLAQFRRHGVAGVLTHYVYHGVWNLVRERRLGAAFRDVPFEREARAFQALQELVRKMHSERHQHE